MSFNTKLATLLKTNPRFVDDEGELVLAAVQDRAWKIDRDLVKLLLSDKEIKAKFFEEIEGHWIFNLNTFIDYISQKNFLVEIVFSESCAEIKSAYSRLGHRMGWRFLNSPQVTFTSETPIALITMNPGGSEERPDHARESSEAGSAYIVESWGHGNVPGEAPLQRQIRSLFAMLAAAQGGRASGDELLHESLAAHFVPFRSPTFKALARPRESLSFASQLWARLFKHLDPKLVITIDQDTSQRLSRILREKLGGAPSGRRFPVGWGNYTAEILSFESGNVPRAILRFPHLSRFRLFGRPQSQPHLERIIEVVAPSLR